MKHAVAVIQVHVFLMLRGLVPRRSLAVSSSDVGSGNDDASRMEYIDFMSGVWIGDSGTLTRDELLFVLLLIYPARVGSS